MPLFRAPGYQVDKAYMMVSSNAKSRPRAEQICEAAKKGGARTTFLCEDVGKHDFPVSAYPKVRIWLHEAAVHYQMIGCRQ